ncbi:uncharacterized protein LOC118435031 [Folsomia candida]|nr:uncharacterized protein LOC118435031 [Folsomia candida]
MYQVEQNPQNAAILTTKPPEPVPISGPGQTTEDIQRISSTETLFKEMDAKHIAEIQGDTSQVETVAPPEILPVEEPPPPVNDIITEQVATLGSPEIPSSPQQISLNDETETINTAEKVDDMLPTDQVTSTQIQPQIDEAVDQIALESLPQMSSVEEIDISATLDTATPAAQITNDDSNLLPNSEAEKPSMDGQQQENDT